MLPRTTLQLLTEFADASRTSLVTRLVERPLRGLVEGEILVEMLFVPFHGSFWLASHPSLLHPRHEEFLRDGAFVFGNGGVGRVLAVAPGVSGVGPGDFVTVFGHSPCRHANCRPCSQEGRYVECEYGESTILGHGKGANDGTYSQYAILPSESWEVCVRVEERGGEERLVPFMYGFVLADVRNALTRHPESAARRRMLLFGAGLSGQAAAFLHLRSASDASLVVVEPVADRALALRKAAPERVTVFVPDAEVVRRLNSAARGATACEQEVDALRMGIVQAMNQQFAGRRCDVVFDASSGNAAAIWATPGLLPPGCHCIPFGFGLPSVILPRELLQTSGLVVQMSRGVGTRNNRRAVIELLKAEGADFLASGTHESSRRLPGLKEAFAFVQEQHQATTPDASSPAWFSPMPL